MIDAMNKPISVGDLVLYAAGDKLLFGRVKSLRRCVTIVAAEGRRTMPTYRTRAVRSYDNVTVVQE